MRGLDDMLNCQYSKNESECFWLPSWVAVLMTSWVGAEVSGRWLGRVDCKRWQRVWPQFRKKVNCFLYFKIGACRHGDQCSQLHHRPTFSQTIALRNVYRKPQISFLVLCWMRREEVHASPRNGWFILVIIKMSKCSLFVSLIIGHIQWRFPPEVPFLLVLLHL